MNPVLAWKAANLIIWIDVLCGKWIYSTKYILAAFITVKNLYLKHLMQLRFQTVIQSKHLH